MSAIQPANTRLTREELRQLRIETESDLRSQGILKPVRLEYAPKRQPEIDPSIKKQLEAMRPGRRKLDDVDAIDQSDDPARATTTLRMQDDMRGPAAGFWVSPIVDNTVYELARFTAPPGQFGVVKLIATWHEVQPNGFIAAAGSGTPYDPRALTRNNIYVRWLLRFRDSAAPPGAPIVTTPVQIPGTAPTEIAFWDDGRYLWGTPNVGVFLPVPPNTVVHLFAHILNGGDNLAAIGGRLQGYTQTIRHRAAMENAAKGWNW